MRVEKTKEMQEMLDKIFRNPNPRKVKEIKKVVHEQYGDWIYYEDGTKIWHSIGD